MITKEYFRINSVKRISYHLQETNMTNQLQDNILLAVTAESSANYTLLLCYTTYYILEYAVVT